MKKIPLIILLLCLSKAYAQRLIGHDASTQPIATNGAPRMADNTKIHLVDSIQVIDADVLPYKTTVIIFGCLTM
jgi:ABC-type methionine transport system permease subunit